MKRLALLLLLLLAVCPAAQAEGLDGALDTVWDGLSLRDWQDAYDRAFPQGEDFRTMILKLAKGERVLDPEGLLRSLASRWMGALTQSLWRLARLVTPAVFCGVLRKLRLSFARPALGEALDGACFLLLAGCMAQDLGAHMRLTQEAVAGMADLMQSLFPLLLTLLAAVGGTAGAAFFQPAVVAASGTMTELVRSVSLPLALAAGTATILSRLSPRMRISRLCALLKTAASWTLGVGFTVFISVTALQSLGAAAADGVSIRAAKYAVEFVITLRMW